MSESARIAKILKRCRNDPDRFNSVFLGRPPYWSRQREICESICRHHVTVAYSGNAIGKDFLLAGVVLWWLLTRPGSLCVVTGPSQTLLGTVTFKEIRRALISAPLRLGAKVSQGAKASPQIVDLGNGWQALGYSTNNLERASGQHAKDLLVCVEEASAVEEETWDALESLKYSRLLAIGNPTRAAGRFIDYVRQAAEDRKAGIADRLAVNAIRIPSTESPHADLEHSPYGLADKTWIEAMGRRYGVRSLWYRSHILAEIPETSSDELIPATWLDYAASIERPTLAANHPVHRTRRIAADLGEGVGRDSTAIIVRDDLGILECGAANTLSLGDAASEIARLARKWNVEHGRISYDKLGIGRDLRNHLVRNGIESAIPYAGSGKPQDPKAFTNLRGEAAWALRRRLNPDWMTDPRYPTSSKQQPFCIPPGPYWALLREDLEALTYDLVGNKTRLLDKETLCANLGRSPDRGDALIQSFAFERRIA
jgi:hypothetical protein